MSASDIAETLRALQSHDNTLRSAAEARFSDARSQQPVQTVAALIQALQTTQLEDPLREQAAVLLRQCLGKLREENSAWVQLGVAAQGECKKQLLQLFEVEASPKVRRKVADIVTSLGNQMAETEGERPHLPWPEVMPTLMRIVADGAKSGDLRSDALLAVKGLLASVWPVMTVNAGQTVQLLATCFNDAQPAVRASAAAVLCELLDQLDAKADRALMKPLIEGFVGAVKAVAECPEKEHINAVLEALEGTENSVDFFKEAMASHIMPLLCVVAKSHKEDDTRRLALEVIITFGEAKPKALSAVPGYIQSTLDVCAKFLMELSDDVQEWAEQDEEEAEDEENFTNGKEVIDRLARCMNKVDKFSLVSDALKPAISALMQSSEWKNVVAGLAIIAQIAEYIDDEATLVQLAAAIKAHLRNPHVRVRYNAWAAIGQFANDHNEVMTNETLAPQLLPEFLLGLDDQGLRVVSCCMSAFDFYGQAVERELLEPFLQPFMEKLGLKLQTGTRPMQKLTITFIAVLALQMEDGFAAYYGPLMPVLKTIVQNTLHKTEERQLLGKAFECISLLAKAVGPATFRADAEAIMQAMIQATQVPDLPRDDPVKEYMLAASQRICVTMKGDFVPFVSHILPSILEKFTLTPKEVDPGQAGGIGEDEEVNLSLVQGEGGKIKVMVISTSEMEELQSAVECVHTFVEQLRKLYAPFVAQTAQALLPVFEFSMGEGIRDMAFETWGQLCTAAREGGEGAVLAQLVQKFLECVLPKLESTEHQDVEALKTRADGIKVCLKAAGPSVLSPEKVRHICQVALSNLDASFRRRETKNKPNVGTGDDDDGVGDDPEDEEQEAMLRIACSEIIGAAMQHHPDIFVAEVLPLCLPIVVRFFQPGVPEAERRLSLFFSCDFLEHLGSRATSFWPQFLPQLLQDIVHPSAELRQPACYGASLAAKEPAFAQFAAAEAAKLAEVITQSRGRAKKKSEKPAQACADNALTALLNILLKHQQTVAANESTLWGVWLQGLPCQEDDEEGQKNHAALLELVQAEKREVVGDAGANLPQVLSIFVHVYRTDFASEETSKGIGQLVLKLGQERLEKYAQQLKDKQQKKMLRIYREAQNA